MDLEFNQLAKLEEQRKVISAAVDAEQKHLNLLRTQSHAIEVKNRFLYLGLGFVLSAIAIAFYVLYGMVSNPGSQILAKDSVVFVFAFGVMFIAAWIIDQ